MCGRRARRPDGPILRELFERAARAAGHAGLWRSYVSGRLGLSESDDRLRLLAAAAAPSRRAGSDELAARHGLDAAALWWVIVEAVHAGARHAPAASAARPGVLKSRR